MVQTMKISRNALEAEFLRDYRLEIARSTEIQPTKENEAETTPGDEFDLAQALGDAELRASLGERHSRRAIEIEAALRRLREGGHGVCEECGDPIPSERLKALPLAVRCRDCQEDHEKAESNRQRADSIGSSVDSLQENRAA